MSKGPMHYYHTKTEEFGCTWETLCLLELVVAARSHLVKSLVLERAVKRMTPSEG